MLGAAVNFGGQFLHCQTWEGRDIRVQIFTYLRIPVFLPIPLNNDFAFIVALVVVTVVSFLRCAVQGFSLKKNEGLGFL